MELVYLWVEGYKNIKEQGFNFSPRFECTFHDKYKEDGTLEENCKLDIKPKEHIENFFGENINVTAIVGKNGSGKSGIFEALINQEKIIYVIACNENRFKYYSKTKLECKYSQCEWINNIDFFKSNFNLQYLNISPLENKIEQAEINYLGTAIKGYTAEYFDKFLQMIKDKNTTDEFHSLFKKFNLLKLDEMSGLSSGEKVLFYYLSSILYIVGQYKDDYNIIFIDEIELFMHPTWQKRTLNIFLEVLEESQLSTKLHLIIATHSPFLLSDLPKENVIFLDTYDKEKTEKDYPKLETKTKELEDGACINVSEHIKINPFGANIHTLLSDGFFMEDGLMGEFAKGKINDVYDYISNPNSKTNLTQIEAKEVINLIGEPILKKELQYLYYEKFETSEIDKKIREHQEEIERLQAQRRKND